MTELPEPLSPPDCELRGYTHMPLFGNKLFNSRIYRKAIRDPRAGLAAIKLWWVAWQECPAGSLPNDDDDLAMLADFGLDMKGWAKARELALHGFVLCSDGRLYHPLICEAAVVAYAGKLKGKAKREADAERLRLWRLNRKTSIADDTGSTDASSDDETSGETRFTERVETRVETQGVAHSKRIGEGEGEGEKKEVRAEATASDAEASPALPDARDRIWSEGLPILQRLTGKPPSASRSMLGRLLRDCGDDCPRALLILRQAVEARPVDPVAWLTRAAAPMQHIASRPSSNGATELRRQAERQGMFLAEIPE